MIKINDGGPAFPQHMIFNPHGQPATAGMYFPDVEGMSLRDWMAGMALQGMYSNPAMIDTFSHHPQMVDECLRVADEYIAARDRKEDQ